MSGTGALRGYKVQQMREMGVEEPGGRGCPGRGRLWWEAKQTAIQALGMQRMGCDEWT